MLQINRIHGRVLSIAGERGGGQGAGQDKGNGRGLFAFVRRFFAQKRQKAALKTVANRLYAQIVAQARQPFFYTDLAVGDQKEGRLELLVLHLVLTLRRIRRESSPQGAQDAKAGESVVSDARLLHQALLDRFFEDVEENMRVEGIGDEGVFHRIRKTGKAFYGREQAYQQALAQPDGGALADALRRNVYWGSPLADSAQLEKSQALAKYCRASVQTLEQTPFADIMAGMLRFAPLADISGPSS